MAGTEQCGAPGCDRPAVTTLDVSFFCREHFISTCYEQIDEYAELLADRPFRDTGAQSARKFLTECTRQATDLAQNAPDLDNLERARLLDILLRAADACSHLRRSSRKAGSVAIRLRSEKLGRAWEEETETRVLSRYGAMLECQHLAEPGEILLVTRLDTGQQARARVAWRELQKGAGSNIGIEFLTCDNFWELDWNEPEPALWQSDTLGKAAR